MWAAKCNTCRLCGELTQDMVCEACHAARCVVCGVWIVADEAEVHMDECFSDQEALNELTMVAQSKKYESSPPRQCDSHTTAQTHNAPSPLPLLATSAEAVQAEVQGKRKAVTSTNSNKRQLMQLTQPQANCSTSKSENTRMPANGLPAKTKSPSRPISEGVCFACCSTHISGQHSLLTWSCGVSVMNHSSDCATGSSTDVENVRT